ncbi:NAD-dependent epimerase/dehydratase family protein [bacterium]|nr:NAD-dependent epimerase/dehydratase family protein [bacterium]
MKRILVTGATGYIGSRLIRALVSKEYLVRAMVRREDAAGRIRMLYPSVEIAIADVMDTDRLDTATR